MDQLLITNSRYIRLANHHGLSKMIRNILALQQNLKNIGDEPLQVDFDRSRKFWQVFGAGPKVSRFFSSLLIFANFIFRKCSIQFEMVQSLTNLKITSRY